MSIELPSPEDYRKLFGSITADLREGPEVKAPTSRLKVVTEDGFRGMVYPIDPAAEGCKLREKVLCEPDTTAHHLVLARVARLVQGNTAYRMLQLPASISTSGISFTDYLDLTWGIVQELGKNYRYTGFECQPLVDTDGYLRGSAVAEEMNDAAVISGELNAQDAERKYDLLASSESLRRLVCVMSRGENRKLDGYIVFDFVPESKYQALERPGALTFWLPDIRPLNLESIVRKGFDIAQIDPESHEYIDDVAKELQFT